jgi:hypothetical protein
MHKIVAKQQALACIVFGKICLYEGNGFVLFEDVGLTSTLKSIIQEYGCARHIMTRVASLSVLRANVQGFDCTWYSGIRTLGTSHPMG